MPHTLESSARVSVQCATHTHTAEGQGSLQGSCGQGLASRRDGLRPSRSSQTVWGVFANGGVPCARVKRIEGSVEAETRVRARFDRSFWSIACDGGGLVDSGSGWLELSLAPIVLAVTTSRSDGRSGDRTGSVSRIGTLLRPLLACLLACFRSFFGSVTYCRRMKPNSLETRPAPARRGRRSHVELRHASALRGVEWFLEIRTCGQVRAARRWQGDCHGAISLVGEPRIPGVKTRSADSATATASATARTVRAPRYTPARRRTYGIYGNAPAAGTAAGEAANRRSTFDRLPYGCLFFMYCLLTYDFRLQWT